MSAETSPTQSSLVFAWSVVIAATLAISFSFLGSYLTLGSHEVIAAVPAREMLHSGDWIVPRYGDVPRVQKPPLVYWLVAASAAWVFGGFSEFAVRFHSAIAFIGLTALMSLWAARWYGREAAFGAALIQMTSFWALNFGRHVEIDMLLCLLTTAAMFLIATQPEDEAPARSRLRWIGILTLIGLTWLAKFHYGMAMVLGPVFVGWVIQRRWSHWRNLINPVGLLILAACALVWPWLLLREYPEALERIRLETVGRALGELKHEPWWYYGPKLLLLPLPWTGHILLAASQSWMRAWRHNDARERFLWIWLAIDVLIVSLSSNKHINYLLAAMPMLTLLGSQTIARSLAGFHRDTVRIPSIMPHVVALASVVAGVAISFQTTNSPAMQAGIQAVAGVVVCAAIVIWWCWQRRRWATAGWMSLASTLAIFLIAVGLITPELDRRQITAEFAQRVRAEFLKDQPVCVFVRGGTLAGFHPSIFYLGEPVYQVSTFAELLREVRRSGELLAVVDRVSLSRFHSVAPFVELQEIARMTQMAGSREQPLVCLRLTDRRPSDLQTATATTDNSPATEPIKRR